MIVITLFNSHCVVSSFGKITQPNFKGMLLKASKGSFTELYPQDVIGMYGFYETTALAESIPGYKEVFKELGLLKYSKDYRHILLRILMQPTNELSTIIQKFLQEHDMTNSISIQIRMGSKYAANKESDKFMSEARLMRHMLKINRKKDKEYVYLSTDSPSMIPVIQNYLSHYKIIQDNSYRVGHTRKPKINPGNYTKNIEGFKRAVVDAIIASHGTTVYKTERSSFGDLIDILSFNTECYALETDKFYKY